ncbi:DUF190 domain-containing protein [Methanococcus aeolicus]|uniref:Uncharacterized protein n=1 Tax=Methanococcus aeolicus (strain ATCC BAA-1280 / DSM 17508 / OCM 812 / Nankai-3) TaxID=419665 RepID=A6USY8_META3|nr:DUF190 domain-containing protein [Methanococcus aeolicus]ABR55610.1 protein of unknown function DUF190 [Methanococcus aeolicus Nankai-3]UXM85108.1 DUF190 domain-containing protein [Methanococcus aeolicus]
MSVNLKNAKMIRIYIKEQDEHAHMKLYKYIVEKLKEYNISGATIFKGINGYGERGTANIDIIRLSMDLPVVIECIDEIEKIDKILGELVEIIGDNGLIAVVDVNIVSK